MTDTIPAPRRRRRTIAQRLVLSLNLVVVLACFVTAAVVYWGSEKANDRKVVSLVTASGGTKLTLPPITDPVTGEITEDPNVTEPERFFDGPVDMRARNFLITGSDNGACIDPDSPYAPAFGNRSGLGERADTIMILRLDPVTSDAAVLSFPRDLWVKISGKSSRGRINSAFNRDDPNVLLLTIWENFGILVDHYVNVDFCAFKKIVDAVGGVKVPFATPVRDRNTGLLIENPGCHTFGGEEGLAYVRSRHLQYYDARKKVWKEDPASDRGRISRQQDFLRRALQKALDKVGGNPTVAKELIDAGLEFLILDDQLTVGKLLELAQAMRDLDPSTMTTYQIEGTGKEINGASVIEPTLKTEYMKSVLSVFQGKVRLVDAPEELFAEASTTTAAGGPSRPVESPTVTSVAPARSTATTSGASTGGTSTGGTMTTMTPTTVTTLPGVFIEGNQVGIVPTDDPACR